jgi:hypothetical protein
LLTTTAQLEYARAAQVFNEELQRRIKENAHLRSSPATASQTSTVAAKRGAI